jgi:(p)ppGpp synthase/HD superfamily hydrolase
MSQDPEGLLASAIALAERAHAGQLDKAGAPYIGHPMRVVNSLGDPVAKIVGALHDAVEDSDLTLEDLARLGFPGPVVAAVDAVTKRDGESYEGYLERVQADPIALQVKIADMQDNMNLARIPRPTPEDHRRLEKYRRVLPQLQAALARFAGTTPQQPGS